MSRMNVALCMGVERSGMSEGKLVGVATSRSFSFTFRGATVVLFVRRGSDACLVRR
jgi:hypothetical protein